MHSSVRAIPIWRLFVLLGVLALVFVSGAAAVPMPNQPKALAELQKMRAGTLNVKDNATYKEALDSLAEWLAFRLDHAPFNGEEAKGKVPGQSDNIDQLLDEAATYFRLPPVDGPDKLNNQLENYKILAERLNERLLQVMKEPKKIVKVNAARMLALAGRLPTDTLAPTYLKMIRENAFPPEVKLYAFQGLGNLLATVDPKDPSRGVIPFDSPQYADICKELEAMILFSYNLPKPVAPKKPISNDPKNLDYLQKLRIYEDAMISYAAMMEPIHVIQFIRREAIRALAQMKLAVIRNRDREVAARPIATLIRVVQGWPEVNPAFSDTEKIEALIGICQMRPDNVMNVDTVAHVVAPALLELNTRFGEHKNELTVSPRNKPAIPWKMTGYRLNEAMKMWKAHAEKLPADRNKDYVVKLVEASSTKFLARLEADGIAAAPDPSNITTWRTNYPLKSPLLFSDDPQSKITGP